jgi:hypothetical protein
MSLQKIKSMVKDQFLVVVPTHRPEQSADCVKRLQQSLTYPTDFHVLDGTRGKMPALNNALASLLTARHTIYCTVDDDILLPDNWQHSIACAFDRVANLGACGIDYRGSIEGEQLMAAAISATVLRVKDIEFRDCTGLQNVAGGCLAMPARLAERIGPYPYAHDGRQYHMDEDAWRCHQVTRAGYRIGYVTCPNGTVQMLQHTDTQSYQATKAADIERWKCNPTWQ